MTKIFLLFVVLTLAACEVGKFTPERHAQYDAGRADCEKTPSRCINGYPW